MSHLCDCGEEISDEEMAKYIVKGCSKCREIHCKHKLIRVGKVHGDHIFSCTLCEATYKYDKGFGRRKRFVRIEVEWRS